MVICSERNNEAGYTVLILVFSLLLVVPQAFGEDPNIGKSVDIIYFEGDVVSTNFQIWSAGTGTLNYSIDINGTYANHFTVDDVNEVNGQSTGISDKKTHTVDVNYGQLHDIVLNARIVITENNDVNLVSYINLLAQAPSAEPNEPNETPGTSKIIGKSTGHIDLFGNVVSKRFQIWNKSSGTLEYTAAVIDGEDYFTVEPEEGQSQGAWDRRTHTVTVDYNEVVSAAGYGGTVTGEIEITDNNDGTSYIELSATDTVATHVSRIAIEQGVNYDISLQTYDFFLSIETDDKVDVIDFNTPQGQEYSIPEYSENEDGTIRYWTYWEEFEDVDGLADYGDGRYTILVTYDDSNVAQTTVNFGIPNKAGTIVWPVQEPVIIYPEEGTVSPVRFEWEKCVDPNAGSIRLYLDNIVDDVIVNSIEKEYSKGTTKSSSINLDAGQWLATLSFGKWYQSENDDDIPYEVGKSTRGYSAFEIMKKFGTFNEFKNHPLKIADCCGTEVTFNLTGGGYGEITGDTCEFESVELSETTEKSVLSIKTADGNITTIGGINAEDGDIKSITGPKVDLEGSIIIAGSARSIALNNASGSINIGSSYFESPKIITCLLKFNEADDLDLESYTPIKSLQAAKWLAGSIDAPWISAMTIKGEFGADLTLSGDESPKGMTLKNAKISGEIGGEWNINDGNCGSIAFASSADSTYTFAGNIGTIKAMGNKKTGLPATLSGSWQFDSVKTITAAGINQCDISVSLPVISDKPAIGKITVKEWLDATIITATAAGDISSISAGGIKDSTISTEGLIGKIENKGIRDNAFCFINSNISADRIGTASISYAKYDNGEDGPFGLTASAIDKLTLKDSSQKTTWLDPNLPLDPIIDFEIKPPE